MFCPSTNEVRIDIRSFNISAIVGTIIHEMCHAQQYQDGRLVVEAKDHKWNGEVIASAKNHDEYLNLPWEIEARKMSEKHLNRVLNKIQKELAK